MINFDKNRSNKAPLIESIGVTKVYDNFGDLITAVTDVSLSIKSGEIVTLYGPPTSGKSTLLRILAGIEKPDVGEVLLKGEPYYEFNSSEQSFIRLHTYGLVPDNICEMSHLNVLHNVAFPNIALGVNEKEALQSARDILSRLNLSKYESKPMARLDTYHCKLVALARSLINQPWIIFVDEPFFRLKHQDSEKMAEVLAEVNRDYQVAVIVATNDPIYLSRSTKAYLMDGGRLVDFDAGENPVERLSQAIDNIKKKHNLKP